MSNLMSSKRDGVLSISPLCYLHYQLHLGAQQQLYGRSGHRILTCQYPWEDTRLIPSLSLILSLSLRSLRTFHGRAQHTSIRSQKPELGRMHIPGLVPGKGNQSVPGLGVCPHPWGNVAVWRRRYLNTLRFHPSERSVDATGASCSIPEISLFH